MNAKTRNKIATAGIYTLVSIVVIILFGILGDILVSEAERSLQIAGGHISEVCKHRKGRLTAGGYRWEYKNGQEN